MRRIKVVNEEMKDTALVSCTGCYKLPPMWWLHMTQIFNLTFMKSEAQDWSHGLKSRCWRGGSFWRPWGESFSFLSQLLEAALLDAGSVITSPLTPICLLASHKKLYDFIGLTQIIQSNLPNS